MRKRDIPITVIYQAMSLTTILYSFSVNDIR